MSDCGFSAADVVSSLAVLPVVVTCSGSSEMHPGAIALHNTIIVMIITIFSIMLYPHNCTVVIYTFCGSVFVKPALIVFGFV